MYTLKNEEIPKNFACIYKINFPNGKIYIGRTVDLKRRVCEHNHRKPNAVCDFAIKKYGEITEWEILQDDFTKRDIYESEKFWINYFNSADEKIGYNISIGGKDTQASGEDNSRSVFSNLEVLDIRKRRYNREKKLDVYKDYNDRNFKTFEKIWQGKGYSEIGKEFLTSVQYGLYSGESNPSTDLKENQIIDIRTKYYKERQTQKEIQQQYPFIPKTTLNNIIQFKSWQYVATEYRGLHRFHGKKKVVEEVAQKIKKDIVSGLSLKEIKQKYSDYNLKQVIAVVHGDIFTDLEVDGFEPVFVKNISKEKKQEVLNNFKNKDKNQRIEDFCKQENISKSTFYRILKQEQK